MKHLMHHDESHPIRLECDLGDRPRKVKSTDLVFDIDNVECDVCIHARLRYVEDQAAQCRMVIRRRWAVELNICSLCKVDNSHCECGG